MTEEKEELDFTDEEKELLIQKGLLLTQFLQSDKMVQFIDMNFDLIKEEGTKSISVVEVPDDEALRRAQVMMKEQVQNSSVVQQASARDIKKFGK